MGIGNRLGGGHDPLKALNGLFRAKDHAEALAGQVQQARVVRAQFHEPIQQRLRPGDLEAGAQGSAGIHQRHQVLRIFPHRLLEQLKGLVEAVELPQRTGLLQLRNVNPETGNDAGRALRRANQSRRAKLLIPVLGHLF